MPGFRLVLLCLLAASFLGAAALGATDPGQVPWAVSRASGLTAFVVLSASVVMGLLISTRAGDGVLSRGFVFDMHQFLSVASLALIGVHAGSLLFDGFLHFTPLSLVVPFASPYRPFAVGIGVIAGWIAAIITASFWFRSRTGTIRWRTLHYATFLAYFSSLAHGVMAGTDTHLPFVYWGYVVSLAAVTSLTTLRISGYRSQRRATARAKPSVARLPRPAA
jgi:methionine sulfoxide reductase heme-binding subunit